MNPQLHRATTSDIPTILKMMEVFNSIDGYPFHAEIRTANLKEFIGNPELGSIFLIHSKENRIGYLALTFGYSFEYEGRDAFIDELFIEAGYRNQGAGKRIMSLIADEASTLGVKALHLEVENHNESAHRLYLNSGFVGNQRGLLTKKLST